MESRSFPVRSYEFSLSNKNQSVFVLHKDFLCLMPALQNLTHQPEALFTSQGSHDLVKLLPHWGSFIFRPRYQVFIIVLFLKWSFANEVKWMLSVDWWESVSSKKLCLCSVCLFLLTSTINQAKINKSMLHRPPSHLAEKTVLLQCKLRKPELFLQGQRKSLSSSGSDHLVLEMISMSRDVQVVLSWRLFALWKCLAHHAF